MQVVAGRALRIEHLNPQRRAVAEDAALGIKHGRGEPERDGIPGLRQVMGDRGRRHADRADGARRAGEHAHLAGNEAILGLRLRRPAGHGVIEGLALGLDGNRGGGRFHGVAFRRARVGRGVDGEEILDVALGLPGGGNAGGIADEHRLDASLVQLRLDRLGQRLDRLEIFGGGLVGLQVAPFFAATAALYGAASSSDSLGFTPRLIAPLIATVP